MQNSLIFDVGCHDGRDSDFYLRKGFTVIAVEANPHLCAQLRSRFATLTEAGRFLLVEKAIAEREGEVTFYMNVKASIWGTIRPDWAARNAAVGADSEKVTVASVKFSSLIQQFGVPHYLKIDIEGADRLCLEGLLGFKDKPQFVSIEIEHRSLLRQEMRLLRQLGYKRYLLVEQGPVEQQVPPKPAREGNYVDYRFEHGASGLFGKELPGPWLTRRRFMVAYYKVLVRNRLLGLAKRLPLLKRLASLYSISWYDIHATITEDI